MTGFEQAEVLDVVARVGGGGAEVAGGWGVAPHV